MINDAQPQGIELVELDLAGRSTQGAARKRKSLRSNTNIYDRLENPALFEQWWNDYREASQELGRLPGGKKDAAEHWYRLERKNTNMDLVIEATEWDIADRLAKKKRGLFAPCLPDARRYLAGGYWETAIEQKWLELANKEDSKPVEKPIKKLPPEVEDTIDGLIEIAYQLIDMTLRGVDRQ